MFDREARVVKACIIVAALAAVSLALAGCGGSKSNEDAVKQVLTQELAFAQKGDLHSAYALLSPQTQQTCSYDDFAANLGRFDLSELSIADLRVTVHGDTATADYTVHYGTRSQQRTGDAFVKVKGKWYDEHDAGDSC